MAEPQTNTKLVQKVRTFADDVRRIKERSGAIVPPDAPEKTSSSPASPSVSGISESPIPSVRNRSVPASRPQEPHVPYTPTAQPRHLEALAEQQAAPSSSHLSDEPQPLDIRKEADDSVYEPTIIRETRQKRWGLGKALGNSFTAWV
ncbi:MAG: hypothetical protein AAB288_09490, partial [Acidobacteriota bacterium]